MCERYLEFKMRMVLLVAPYCVFIAFIKLLSIYRINLRGLGICQLLLQQPHKRICRVKSLSFVEVYNVDRRYISRSPIRTSKYLR